MARSDIVSRFEAPLVRAAQAPGEEAWGFVVLPRSASDTLPRRGRTTVRGTLNGAAFQLTLDPDGQRSHWMRIGDTLRRAAGAEFGDTVRLEIQPLAKEPDPELPADFEAALAASPEAWATWRATTPLARVDWIHWMTTARQAKTRAKRIADACQMLAAGKKRVCCFDPSGFYSKTLSTPAAADRP